MSNNTIYGQMLNARKTTIEQGLVPVIVERLMTHIKHYIIHVEPAVGYKPALVQIHPNYISSITNTYKGIEDDVLPLPYKKDHSHLQPLLYNFSRLFLYFMHHPAHSQKEALVEDLVRHHVTQRLWYLPLVDFITLDERHLMLSNLLSEWSELIPEDFFTKEFSMEHFLHHSAHKSITCVVRLIRAYTFILGMDGALREEQKNLATRLTAHDMGLKKWHDKGGSDGKEVNFDLNPLSWIPQEGPLNRILNPEGDELKVSLSSSMNGLWARFYKPTKAA